MAVCILVAILCGTHFYGIFLHSSNPLNPASAQMWQHQRERDNDKNDNGTLYTEIHECHSKIVRMLDEVNAQPKGFG
jgi:hypothetical protein